MLYIIDEINYPERNQESDFHLSHWKTTHKNYPYFFREKTNQPKQFYINGSFQFKNYLKKKTRKRGKNENITSALSSCSSNKTEIQWIKFSQESL